MELELKHVAAYLPYNVYAFNVDQDTLTDKIIGLFQNTLDFENWSPLNSDIKNYKLILRSLSDLTKEIEVNGEKFVPLVKLAEISISSDTEIEFICDNNYSNLRFGIKILVNNEICYFFFMHETISFYYSDKNNTLKCVHNQYEMFQKLLSWHFDLFNLIKNNLAIDINTLEK